MVQWFTCTPMATTQIGLFMYLPEAGRCLEQRERKVVAYKGSHYYVEEREEQPAPLKVGVRIT